jgi:phosphoserine phosphatase
VNALDADQPPLGTSFDVDESDSRARTIDLSPGDALVLITDGFFECKDKSGAQLGIARLGESIRRHQALPADHFIKRLHAEVVEFSQGNPQADDLTAVAIKRTGAARPIG